MERPLTRPAVPMSIMEFVDKVERHFLIDNSPRCVNDEGLCIYTSTGCMIGFVLTKEDAEQMPQSSINKVFPHRNEDTYMYSILNHYFKEIDNPAVQMILTMGQLTHDVGYHQGVNNNHEAFKERIRVFVYQAKSLYRTFVK